jgi:hypothetical protein
VENIPVVQRRPRNTIHYNPQTATATGGSSFFGAGGSALAFNVAGSQTNQTKIGG